MLIQLQGTLIKNLQDIDYVKFLQYESVTIFLREMKYIFFSLYLSSQKYIFIFLLSLLYILKKQKTVLILLSLILEILKFLFPFA